MKTVKYFIIALLLPLFGCTTHLEEINVNPNATDKVPTPYILTYVQRDLATVVYDVWNSGRQSSLICQHWSQRNYTSEDRYQFRRETSNAFYRSIYIRLQSCQDIINLNTNEATKEMMGTYYGDNDMQIATAMLLKVWGIQLMAETFGDVPYIEANKGAEVLLPKYDKQSDLFPKLLADVDDAIARLKRSERGWEFGDVMYDGDIDSWIKFANSLKLRLLLRMSNVKADWKSAAKAINVNELFSSVGDRAGIQYVSAGAPNEAPLYNGFISRNDFTYTKQFMGLLMGKDDTDKGFANPFKGIVDPRINMYIGSVNVSQNRFTGMPYGMSDAATSSFASANSSSLINLRTSPRPYLISANAFVTFLDYPTVCFMLSEVYDWDKTWFEKGLKASLQQWNVADNGFVNSVMAVFDAAGAEKKKEIVITQKYIHLLGQSFEAWSEYRRTGYPLSLVKPGEVSNNGVTFVTVNDTKGEICPRLLYDSNEYKINKTNVEAAAASIGGDTYATKLWWAKK